jgi:hypothetical protein
LPNQRIRRNFADFTALVELCAGTTRSYGFPQRRAFVPLSYNTNSYPLQSLFNSALLKIGCQPRLLSQAIYHNIRAIAHSNSVVEPIKSLYHHILSSGLTAAVLVSAEYHSEEKFYHWSITCS